MLLTIVSVLLYILAFPITCHDISPWVLICFALVPFFLYLEREGLLLRKFLAGAVWGAVMSLGLAYWLAYAMIWQYGISVVATVLFMILGLMLPHAVMYGLFAVMYRFLKENATGPKEGMLFYLLTVPSLWVVTEFLREIIPVLVPWGFAGYALQPFNLYMQMADITGIYGITFLVVTMNAIITYLWRDSRCDDPQSGTLMHRFSAKIKAAFLGKRTALAVLVLIIIIPVSYGAIRRSGINNTVKSRIASGMGIRAAAVQANFTQGERWKSTGFIERVNICLGLAGRCAPRQAAAGLGRAAGNGIVVWPETVLNARGMVNSRLFSFIQSRVGRSSLLVAGGLRRAIGSNGVYNTAYLVYGRDNALFYDKNILLPYAETAPFGTLFGDFYSAPAEFLEGTTPPAARNGMGVIGLSICFEALYPWYARRAVKDGALLLVNISNDGWFGRTSEPLLHLRQASVRAIENRRFMIRSSNNGYSAIISPAGELLARGGLFTRECISGDTVLLESKTVYSILGDWIVYAAVLIILVMLVVIMVRK